MAVLHFNNNMDKNSLINLFKRKPLNSPVLQQIYERCTRHNPRHIIKQAIQDTRFIVLDTETTGFKAYAGDEIVSIAALEMQGYNKTDREFVTLVNPERPIPLESTNIHGITNEHVAESPALNDILPEFIEFIGDAVIIGHHINFDLRFLNKRLQKLVGCSLQNPWLDTMLLHLELSGQVGHYTLEEVAHNHEIEIVERHTAYGDAITTLNVFVALSKQIVTPQQHVSTLIKHQYHGEV